ncbi:iron-containing alcohol dehydrogenase [Pseudofrankia sp. BMG5.37]|uniref:iron-containing alcohol dehydrogenase n=1 Tax=Pseudofrankia sp. BMG5.37 TaxID=3050035 RepID=UPI0028953612|nr:iron-containing alcohol dehydrogenase [Pseudofrankia sp. BMG5.37]MDT3444691.1 iron-containing alcohol dehydrogenase [Pseudofrankia sp. BMG5.37]
MTRSDISEFLFPGQLTRYAGASGDVGDLLCARGVPTGAICVVADSIVHANGLNADLLEGLAKAGYEPQVFADVIGEPDVDVVTRAAVAAAATNPVAFVGIGGGSALDTVKLVAYSVASGTPLRDLKGPAPLVPGLGPLVMVPTTVGTGAEATRVAMFAVDGAKRAVLSRQFVPELAVLDDALVQRLPAPVVAATALDALAHSVESMMSSTSNELTWFFSGEAARRIFAALPAGHKGDPKARSELLYASFLAGVSLNAGVVLGHSLSYVLAARHHLPHGVGCAIALPYCLAYNQTMSARDGKSLAESVLGQSDATLRDVAEAVRALTELVDLPTDLDAYGTAAEEIPFLAQSVVRDYPRPTNPVPLESVRLGVLLEHLRTGDLRGAWTAMGELA